MPPAGQRGQATTEFVVVALALAPLFLLVPLVGKVIDLAQATEAASRYAAFEAVVHHSSSGWTAEDTLAADVRRRFFSHPDAPIKTGDVAGDIPAHRNPLWSDFIGRPLLPHFGDNVRVARRIDRLQALPAARDGLLSLPGDNLTTAAVTATPTGVPGLPPLATLALPIERRTALLADAWTARSAAGIRARIEAANTLYPIAPLRPFLDVAGELPPLVLDPRLRAGEFEWDIVPCDRFIDGC